ncbi:MAG: TIGR01459 family HAD-type hydrolase [Pseudomonadota bacterium]
MTQKLSRLADIAAQYDAIVFDQWGVLHNGTVAYPGAVEAVKALHTSGKPLAVLSNSGKRAAPNASRISAIGFDAAWFETVMTSGEALWQDIAAGHIPERAFFPIERQTGDASQWADGLGITLTPLDEAEAVLLMGLPDGSTLNDWTQVLMDAAARNLPVYCSNPDVHSPRADGLVTSPGALAAAYEGRVTYYGKPHKPVFEALQKSLGTDRLLMVGDSLDHDIAGAAGAGWDSLLIEGGLYAGQIASDQDLTVLVAQKGCPPPTYRMEILT